MSGEESSDEYAALVREQLDALGYNSASIPDSVLREFLRDFESMDVSEEGDDVPLSYPTALSSAETAGVPALTRPPEGAPSASNRPKSKKSAARVSRSASAAAVRGSPPVGMLKGGMPPAPPVAPTGVEEHHLSTLAYDGRGVSAAVPEEDGASDGEAADRPSPPERTHWESLEPMMSSPRASKGSAHALRSMSAMSPRDITRASRPASARPAPPAASCVGGFSGSGVIISASAMGSAYGATPRKAKTDPVSMHARRRSEWRSDPFLSTSAKRPAGTSSGASSGLSSGSALYGRTPPTTAAAPRRRPNSYVVPTSKRRDDLVWATRVRLLHADADAGGKLHARARSKQLRPNRFVPCTEKRRDDVRWAVRSEMAYMR